MSRLVSRARLVAAMLALGLAFSGCAYFNTYYSARRNFDAAERLYLDPDDHANAQQTALYDKAIASAAKVVANYPNSKWVDDAVYITGRSLFAKGEDDKARKTFTELADKFPKSPYCDEGLYYIAETYRREHKYDTAEVFYDSLRRTFPKSHMLVETTMREAQVELAQLRPRNAIHMLTIMPSEKLSQRSIYEWHRVLADAYFAVPSYDSAYVQYIWLAQKTKTPDGYNDAQMRLGDCLEGAQHYDEAADHYHDYEREASTPEYRDQASIRRATAMANAGHVADGLGLLQFIVNDKSRVAVAPQALYQIGFIQETVGEDSKSARATYGKVQDQFKTSPYAQQAQQRLTNLDKMDALRAAAESDTTGREQAAAAAFGVAERLFVDSDRPDRALEEYAKVEHEFPKTMTAPKASFAAGWIYYRKLQHKEAADSVWKHLVATYPETPYGLAASAILRGREDSLRTVGPYGKSTMKVPYSPNAQLYVPVETKVTAQKVTAPTASRADSIRAAHQARADSLAAAKAPPMIVQKPDTTRSAAKADTSHTQARADTTVQKNSASGSAAPVAPVQGGR